MIPTPPDDLADDFSDTEELPDERREGKSRIAVDTVRFDPMRALVRVTGEIDKSTAAALWAVLQGHVGAGRRFLRLDLSGVTSIDAGALSGLTRAHQDLLHQRGTLVLTGVRSLAARVLRLSGLDQQLFIGGPRADDDLPAEPHLRDGYGSPR